MLCDGANWEMVKIPSALENPFLLLNYEEQKHAPGDDPQSGCNFRITYSVVDILAAYLQELGSIKCGDGEWIACSL